MKANRSEEPKYAYKMPELLTKEEQDYKENMNEAVDNALLPDIHSDEEVR